MPETKCYQLGGITAQTMCLTKSYSINKNIHHEVGIDDEVDAYGPLWKTIEIRKEDCSERYNYGDVEEEDGLNERPSHDKVAAGLENTRG